MTTSQSFGEKAPGAGGAVWVRAARAVIRAFRHLHGEQVLMWECWWRASRAPVDRPGPLAWQPSLDGTRLTGSYLPAPGDGQPL